jgi:hypothetical protein
MDLKPKFVVAIQTIYDDWERTQKENDCNIKSQINSKFLAQVSNLILENISPNTKESIKIKIKDLYVNEPFLLIHNGRDEFTIKIPPEIYEHQVKNERIWVKIVDVKFNQEDIKIKCKKVNYKNVTF